MVLVLTKCQNKSVVKTASDTHMTVLAITDDVFIEKIDEGL
jgi:predicted metal-dependent phosphoesterase TrpH